MRFHVSSRMFGLRLASFVLLAGTWSLPSAECAIVAGPKPQIGKIWVAGVPGYSDGTMIMIQKGQKIKLSAVTADQDKDTSTGALVTDIPTVNWSLSGDGSISNTSTDSGVQIEYTAPTTGSFPRNVTITAQADDLPLYADDPPGCSTSVTIKVIDVCPPANSISKSSDCSPTPKWDQWKSFGCVERKMCVSGGTPPNPPNSWLGLAVREELTTKSGGTQCDETNDLNGCTRANFCTGSSTWTLGQGPTGTAPMCFAPPITADMIDQGCSITNSNACLWDTFLAASHSTIFLKAGRGPCDVLCEQKYYCDSPTPTLLGTFTITTGRLRHIG